MDTMKEQMLVKLAEFLSNTNDLEWVIKANHTDEYCRRTDISEKLACVKHTLAELERLNEHD